MHRILTTAAVIGLAFSQTTFAEQQGEHHGDHGRHGIHEKAVKNTASGTGTIHRVSRFTRKINLSHDPIPALDWPQMRMDLDVAEGIDLKGFKTGDKISFDLKLGDDKVYRITRIEKINAQEEEKKKEEKHDHGAHDHGDHH
uniref:Cu(I)/Ag(I) efflux system protein CusF n=1 Tax=Candidatus Kentrum sp. TC TaxID=2126339 RepID=A0A450ZXM5_9GAMM|nr:MAG: Cu(I)/Ag(I) efflux system protein CusF [Candidatus Kentron sp. TC]VFK45644.1 MAG: Cu(I)/Ag(I) efflux system protein CusF [Candidatus Kentron sp. TC]VFK58554.1 MAG: Cu(I)/Ag(I) efflux system protein CusF [Candidatus Kentron sp. TC]